MANVDDRTRLPPESKPDSGWLSDADAISHGRFAPGAVLADRYRIIGLVGRGGMGEVYRADDLKLGQPVALKFLPRALGRQPGRLARFHAEVRLSRQISHPNVCRVYDVGEIDGETFLSMEYVDGEDLSSLLRRIGRLPEDKGLEMARQLCAGVAAAHDRGVLHRDLKPANVMVDGEGRVRVMDFGLAVIAGDGEIDLAGTPAYMAPEQFSGLTTKQSDIYALGLVLFEIFTGRRARSGGNLTELLDEQENDAVPRPSELVAGLDPAIDEAIMRCLDRVPLRRPPSALAVSAALPGGDPLAAALAAGETPSPAMVAAAGRVDALPVWAAGTCLGTILLSLVAIPLIADRVLLLRAIPPVKAVDVLIDRAQTIRQSLGYTAPPRDEFYDIEADRGYLDHIRATSSDPDRWERLRSGRPAPVVFWHRSSPRPLSTLSPSTQPSLDDPPMDVSGMTLVRLDTQGRLIGFEAIPPQHEPDLSPAAGDARQPADAPHQGAMRSNSTPVPAWNALFAAADLDMAAFQPAPPAWTPRSFADTRAAWQGVLPGQPDLPIRIEAAAYRGDPVSFQIIGPWTRAARMERDVESTSDRLFTVIGSILLTAILISLALAARHHLRRGRADRRGADRLALVVLAMFALSWLLGGHHFTDVNAELNAFLLFLAIALLVAAMDWLSYLALEPLVRKWDPRALVGWSRLMNGALRDPHVGRDVLIGIAAGSLFALSRAPRGLMPVFAGGAPNTPVVTSFAPLLGPEQTLSVLAGGVPSSLANAMFLILAFAFLRMLTGRTWLSAAIVIAVLAGVTALGVLPVTGRWTELLIAVPGITMMLVIAVRYGLLTTFVLCYVWLCLEALPLTLDSSMRYFATSAWLLAGIFALALLAAYAARGAAVPGFRGSGVPR